MLQSLLTGVTYVGVFLHQVDNKVFGYNEKERSEKSPVAICLFMKARATTQVQNWKQLIDVIIPQCLTAVNKTHLELIPICQKNWPLYKLYNLF